MAGIDKTYTNSYKDYKEFKEWANLQIVTFFNGYKECIGEWVGDFEESDFNNGEIPIMNSPTWLDIYLIQNCPCKFVQDRMKEVYREETYNEFKQLNFNKPVNPDYKQNRKIIIKKTNRTKIPLTNKGYNSHSWWWLQSDQDWSYHSESKTWSHYDDYYPHDTNISHAKTIKSLIRQLRKQYLPSGLEFELIGRYVGEDYKIIIK